MLLKCIYTELLKLKRNPVWMAFFAIPVFSTLMGTFNFIMNQGQLSLTWESLWTQHTLFLCLFFFPSLIATFCAVLWRNEYMHNNLNSCFTMPVKRSTIFLAKLITAGMICLFSLLWITLLFFIAGKIAGIPGIFSLKYLGFIGCGMLGCIVIISLHMLVSLFIRKFGLNLAVSFGGTIVAFACFAKGWSLYFPYSLFSYGMRANNPKADFDILPFLLSCFVFSIIFILVSVITMNKRDILCD